MRRAFWSRVAGSVLVVIGLFLFAAQRWTITAASVGVFTLGVVLLCVTSWRNGTAKKKRQLVRILGHVIVTIAAVEAVNSCLGLLALVLTGDNPTPDSWGMKVVEWMDRSIWIIYWVLAIAANLTLWIIFKLFRAMNKPIQAPLRDVD